MLRQLLSYLAPLYFLLWASCLGLSIAFDRALRRHEPGLAEASAARRQGLRGHRWILRGEFRHASAPVVRLGRVYRATMISYYLVFAVIIVIFAAAFVRAG